MCRFLAYRGSPIVSNEILYSPNNSLIKQSYQAREREEPLNGDGFGIGWYAPEIGPKPAAFVSIRPAWNNRNLKYIAPVIKTPCLFAHVRAATTGNISEANCHPFHYDKYLMMHNGAIGEFSKVKRQIRATLSDRAYHWIEGQTDTEHLFALLIDNIEKDSSPASAKKLATAIEKTINALNLLLQEASVKEPTYLNLAVSDGEHLVASRYISDPKLEPHTLYYSAGSAYQCKDGICNMIHDDPSHAAVLVVSEKLTDVSEDWKAVPANHMVLVEEDLSVSFQEIT